MAEEQGHLWDPGLPCPAADCVEARAHLLALGCGAAVEREAALAALAEVCWPIVHRRVRALGCPGKDARDLTQGYFERFLERGDFAYPAAWRGCLRAFLCVSVSRFLANERARARARKRGGGRPTLSLDAALERRPAWEPVDAATPESLAVRREAEAALGEAVGALRREMARAGASERFARIEAYLLEEVDAGSYERIAREWGVGASAARVALHRLRKRLGALLRQRAAPPRPESRPLAG